MKKYQTTILIIIMAIVSIGINVWPNYEGISKEEAEEIALAEAKSSGYYSATLWTEFEQETYKTYVYSSKYNKDIKIWKVSIDTDEHPDILNTSALVYFISRDTGEVTALINAVE
ncbi:hypothetical protein M3649_03210 [Ureibacillus chungkukjangi]|uniref:hypothetical protein n=1 Tax=Ureibacillus chungkukjangi TaxID=1202712 RepID=UPI00204121AA|nr:hypothetical protein [Ureibacillus chungkukjangi]MCM3387140.1 hypothetical protein [Ureibacillus chungkukjangi]